MIAREDLAEFISACDNMIDSKFILVDKRIGEVLKAVATTKPVYNAIAENMINFNFSGAYAVATSKTGEFVMPEDKVVGFVFCMLKAINDGKINVNDLLIKHFPSDAENHSSYALFCNATILPFKNLIVDQLCESTKTKKQQEKVVSPIENLNAQILDRLQFLAKDIKAYVVGSKKIKGCKVTKQEYLNIVDAFVLAIESQEKQYFETFAQTLFALAGKDKELKQRLAGIIELIGEVK